MTSKTFDQLEIGDFVADMHDGLAPIRARFNVLTSIQWEYAGFGTPDRKDPFSFPNKELRVLGIQNSGAIVCGYTYDRMYAGIVILYRDATV
jgi:hypothetical protein